jgi:hypothetical protein
MPIIATAGSNLAPAPEGAHAGICVDTIDHGVLKVEFAGQTKLQHKITIVWQIDENRQHGQPFARGTPSHCTRNPLSVRT